MKLKFYNVQHSSFTVQKVLNK